jgi:autotransporter-associated beta strand protein
MKRSKKHSIVPSGRSLPAFGKIVFPVLSLALAATPMAHAATSTWTGTTNGTWDTTTAANWGGTAFSSGNNALFTGTPTNNVTTATGLTIGAITLDNTFTGSVTMSGANTVSGATTINGGTLNLNNSTGLGTSAVSIGASGTANVTVNGNVNNVITGSGTLTVNNAASNPNFNNASGLNGFTGTLNVNTTGGNKISLNTAGEKIGSGATVNITSGGTLYIANTSTSFDGITFNVVGSGNTENLGAIRIEQSSVIGATSSIVLGGNTSLGSNSGTGTINAPISETTTSNITKVGGQTLILAGTNNYSGTTTVSSGTLMIGSGGTTGTLGSGAVTDNATLAFNRSDNITVSNAITGTGALSKFGTGTVTLTGANSNSGTTTIQAGALTVGDGTSGSLGAGALTFANSGTINFNKAAGSSQSIGALTFSAGAGATVQSTYGGSSNTSLTFSNVVARNAGASANFVSSGGANGTTNKIVFTQVAGLAPSTGTLLDKGYFYNGSSYAAYDTGGFVRAYGSGDTNYVTASSSIASSATSNVALTGSISGQGSASVNTLNMGANTLALGTGAAFQTNGILVSGNNASTISGGTSLAATTSGAELVVRVDGSSDALNISTPIIANGANAFTKTGAGTLTLSGTGNAYTGTTTVNSGTLALSGTYTGGGALNVTAGATLTGTSSGTNTIGNFSVNGAGASATLTTGTYTVTSTSGNTAIDNGGSLTVNGGTLNISGGTNNFFPIGNTANTTSTVTIASGAVNVTNNFGIEVGRVGNGILNINGGTFTVNDSGSIGVVIGDQTTAQSGTVNLTGGTLATRKLSSSNGINAFNFNGGTLQATSTNAGASFWASSARLTANVRNSGGTIDNNGTAITFGQALVHSTIGGDNATDGGMTFKGSGTTTLSGVNTYNGNTKVTAGTLALGNVNALQSSALDETGAGSVTFTVTGTNTYNIGGLKNNAGTGTAGTTLAVGANSLTLGSSSDSAVTLANITDFNSVSALNVTTTGAFTLNGTMDVTFSNTFANGSTASFKLISGQTTGSFTTVNLLGSYSGVLNAGNSYSFVDGSGDSFSFNNTTGILSFTAVPESHEFALAIVAFLGVLVFVRRRQALRGE